MSRDSNNHLSYTTESAKNLISLSFVQIATFLLGIVSRGIFIRKLGNDYLGIGGLFSSLLLVLSLSEFGVGEALTYAYIQAFSQDKTARIKAIFVYSKKIFVTVAFIVTVVGVCLMPLIPYLVKEDVFQHDIYNYYLFFLFNNACSYFVGPYSEIYQADQRVRVVSKIQFVTLFLVTIMQMIFLLLIGNYYVYLFIMVLGNALTYILTKTRFKKDYGWLLSKEISINEETFEIRKILFSRMKDTFLVKLSGTVMESIDNIIISRYFGVISVGMYSNYTVIKGTLKTAAKNIYTSIFSSVGILNAKKNEKDKESLYLNILFLFHFIGAFFSICMFALINDFIPIWLNHDSLMPLSVALLIAIDLYLNILLYAPSNFVQTTNVLHYVRAGFVLTAICNLLLSLFLGAKLGLIGVLMATPISRALFCFPSYISKLYHLVFNGKVFNGGRIMAFYFVQTAVVGSAVFCVTRYFEVNGIFTFLIKAVFTAFLCLFVLALINARNQHFVVMIRHIKQIIGGDDNDK